ncbi:MAG: hypothetical protein D6E12_10515 [Desulfovibrio sp.]|nr:MAG: hypothetical protein D6E12_10515 [Desulfovibrio sp.]
MWEFTPPSRGPRPTTMPCRKCGHNVEARRTCFTVYLSCPDCGSRFEVEEYVQDMDEAFEDYLENVFCNRI